MTCSLSSLVHVPTFPPFCAEEGALGDLHLLYLRGGDGGSTAVWRELTADAKGSVTPREMHTACIGGGGFHVFGGRCRVDLGH